MDGWAISFHHTAMSYLPQALSDKPNYRLRLFLPSPQGLSVFGFAEVRLSFSPGSLVMLISGGAQLPPPPPSMQG